MEVRTRIGIFSRIRMIIWLRIQKCFVFLSWPAIIIISLLFTSHHFTSLHSSLLLNFPSLNSSLLFVLHSSQSHLKSQENQIAECEAALNSRTEEIISLRSEKVELTGKLSECESSLALAKAHILELQADLLATQVNHDRMDIPLVLSLNFLLYLDLRYCFSYTPSPLLSFLLCYSCDSHSTYL